jgi:hypothetical protein
LVKIAMTLIREEDDIVASSNDFLKIFEGYFFKNI